MTTEHKISELINHSGRLRMLSHRAGMFITLLNNTKNQSDDWFKDELDISIDKFKLGLQFIHEQLNEHAATYEKFCVFTASTQINQQTIDSIIQYYQAHVIKTAAALKRNSYLSHDNLCQFLKFIGSDLLLSLNTIVQFFEDELNMIIANKNKTINNLAANIEESLVEVDKINLSIKILSFNASVEAARAGELGTGFKVVASEMNRLNAMTREVTQQVNKNVNQFINEVNSEKPSST